MRRFNRFHTARTGGDLGLDPGYLRRILCRFGEAGLVGQTFELKL